MQRLIFSRLPDRRAQHHVALTRLPAGHRTTLHTHDFPELFLVTRGRGVHRWNGRAQRLARGSCAFVRAPDRHCYEAGPNDPLEFINLALAPGWWRRFASLFTPALHPGHAASGWPRQAELAEDATARVEERLHALLARSAQDGLSLMETMVALAREWSPAASAIPPPRQAPPEWLAAVVRDMQRTELIARPLAFWQARSGRSPEHLARSCRRFFGESLTGLLNRARVEWIKSRLRRDDGKIAALALDAGYQNLGYFYRVFRRLEGRAPGAWLKSQPRAATVPGGAK
jgi:AraC family cel operon transcriptional repressor